jgi:hypothetical protein
VDAKLARATWMSVEEGARILGVPVVSFRRVLERSARRRPDGGVEAKVDGILARKFGRLWRVWLDPAWTEPKTGTNSAR